MIVVYCVDDVLLAVLDNAPDGAADHVTSWHRGDAQALAPPLQAHRLVVLQLRIKTIINLKLYVKASTKFLALQAHRLVVLYFSYKQTNN